MSTTVLVPERFRGPPTSGHGGYVCGVFGGLLTAGRYDLPEQRTAEVTLRSPVPLEQPLATRMGEQSLTVHHSETLIAEVQLSTLQLNVPAPPSFAQALAVRERSPALRVGRHPWLGAVRKRSPNSALRVVDGGDGASDEHIVRNVLHRGDRAPAARRSASAMPGVH